LLGKRNEQLVDGRLRKRVIVRSLPGLDDLDDPAGFVNRRDSDFDLRTLNDTPPSDGPASDTSD